MSNPLEFPSNSLSAFVFSSNRNNNNNNNNDNNNINNNNNNANPYASPTAQMSEEQKKLDEMRIQYTKGNFTEAERLAYEIIEAALSRHASPLEITQADPSVALAAFEYVQADPAVSLALSTLDMMSMYLDLLRKANQYISNGDYQKALEKVNIFLTFFPHQPTALNMRRFCEFALQN